LEKPLRILILSQWFHPENNVRADVLAVALAARGHDVQVVTGFPNYPLGRIYEGYQQKLWTKEKWRGIQVLRFPLYPDHSSSFWRRSLTYLTFSLSSSLLSPFLVEPVDVIWVYHPPITIGITALVLSFSRRAPFVFEIQDMWPEMVKTSGIVPSKRVLRALGALAGAIYRGAAALIVISDGFKRNLVDKGVPAEKIRVVPNWGDETNYEIRERDERLGQEHSLDHHFNVMYAGNMGPAQDLFVLLDAAELLRDMERVQFVLIGDGLSLTGLTSQVESRGLRNVRFIGRQPAGRMPDFLAWGDVMLVQLADEELFKMTIPSKLLSYMGSGKPILCAVGGDADQVIIEASAGVTCRPGDAFELAEAIRRMVEADAGKLEEMGMAGRRAFEERYSQRVLLDEYEELLEEVASRAVRVWRP
jgi:colanic acid biosynthesis glycosyl transferase WcaI